MNASHVSGGVLGAILGAVLSASLKRYHVTAITDAEASLIGTAFAAIGVGIAHAVWTIGVGPLFSRIFRGPAKTNVVG